jgi:hypothetical protein
MEAMGNIIDVVHQSKTQMGMPQMPLINYSTTFREIPVSIDINILEIHIENLSHL